MASLNNKIKRGEELEGFLNLLSRLGILNSHDPSGKRNATFNGGKHRGGWRGHRHGMHRQNKHAN